MNYSVIKTLKQCLLWFEVSQTDIVCFPGVTAGSVCGEDQIHSVAVGHRHRDHRNNVVMINKLPVLRNISFLWR